MVGNTIYWADCIQGSISVYTAHNTFNNGRSNSIKRQQADIQQKNDTTQTIRPSESESVQGKCGTGLHIEEQTSILAKTTTISSPCNISALFDQNGNIVCVAGCATTVLAWISELAGTVT